MRRNKKNRKKDGGKKKMPERINKNSRGETESKIIDEKITHNSNDPSTKLENCKYGYDLVNSWIGNADNKVSVSCALLTGIFGVINFLSDRISGNDQSAGLLGYIYYICFVSSLIFIGVSITFFIFAINPNLGSSGNKGKTKKTVKKYPIFFGDIDEMELGEYKNIMYKASYKDLIDELLTETHYNSKIATKKMTNYRNGLRIAYVAVIFALIGWAVRFLMFQLK